VISSKTARAFRRSLLRWYHRHGRDLPWRQTRDPYAILVSEFMLQQTQVATVCSYYSEWLRRFPNFAALAVASECEVLHAWQGLGYYARARNLHAASKMVVNRPRRFFPCEIAQMQQLPGVGRYTAHAVAAFAFDQAVPIVEANTARALARIFNFRKPIDQAAGREAIWNYAAALLPKGSARIYNSALVDLGALVCLPRKPKCAICPVRKFCRATNPEILPIKKARPPIRRLIETHLFAVRQNKILLEQSGNRWCGMWMLPRLHARSTPARPLHTSNFAFTNHRITLRVFPQRPRRIDNGRQRWFSIRSLSSIPIPSPHRRAIVDLFSATRARPPGQQRS
jgi:A/G-specific adenine glycosylase